MVFFGYLVLFVAVIGGGCLFVWSFCFVVFSGGFGVVLSAC